MSKGMLLFIGALAIGLTVAAFMEQDYASGTFSLIIGVAVLINMIVKWFIDLGKEMEGED
ncbi:hypothetical protein MCCARTNEY_124 [Bacillus phage vB_BanH_McCartney]|nr:hypothetical protein MCCARTNEY_124 [Bacillus phage vB_BanH_McCartney]